MSPDKNPRGAGRGRPRVWESAEARRQAHQARRRERERQVSALLDAVRNAAWDEPALQRIVNDGDDREVLAALTDYYRRRHWQHANPLPPPAPPQEAD